MYLSICLFKKVFSIDSLLHSVLCLTFHCLTLVSHSCPTIPSYQCSWVSSPFTMAPRNLLTFMSIPNDYWDEKKKSAFLAATAASSSDVDSAQVPSQSVHTWAQTEFVAEMSSSLDYNLYNLPVLVRTCGFSSLDLWDCRTHLGVALLTLNLLLNLFISTWSGLLCRQKTLLGGICL